MPENQDAIGIVFEVAGKGDINGESGRIIHSQLKAIAESMPPLPVKVKLDEKELDGLKGQLKEVFKDYEQKIQLISKTIGKVGDISIKKPKVSEEYKQTEKDLRRQYDLKKKLFALDETNKEQIQEINRQIAEIDDNIASKMGKGLLTKEEVNNYNALAQALEKDYESAQKLAEAEAKDISTARERTKAYDELKAAIRESKKVQEQYDEEVQKKGDKTPKAERFKKELDEIRAKIEGLFNAQSGENAILSLEEIEELKELDKTLKETTESKRELDTAMASNPTSNQIKSYTNMQSKVAGLGSRFKVLIASNKTANELYQELINLSSESINGKTVAETQGMIDELALKINSVTEELSKMDMESGTLFGRFKKAFGTKIINNFAYALMAFAANAVRQAYQNVVKLNTELTTLRIVTKATDNQMRQFADNIAKSAKKIGASIADLTKATTTYARLGYDLEESAKLSELTTMYSNVSGVAVDEATTNITGALKAFGLGAEELENVLNQFIRVGNSYAISSAEIGEAMNAAGSALAANGNSLQEAIGIITAANTSIQDVSKASTAVRTIAARISASTAELEELGEDAGSIIASADLDAKMRAYGVAIIGANGELRSTYEILSDLADKWDELSTTERAAIAEMMAGTRQQNAFYSIMQNFSDAKQIVADETSAYGELQEAQEKYLDSIQGKLNQLEASFQELSTYLINSELVKFGIDALKTITDVLNKIGALGDGVVAQSALITAAMFGIVAVVSVLKPKIQELMLQFKLFGMELGVHASGVKAFFLTVGASLKKFLAENAPLLLISALIAAMTALDGAWQVGAEIAVAAITLVGLILATTIKSINAIMKKAMETNPFGWILLAITAVIAAIKGLIDLFKFFNPSFEDLKEAAKEAKDAWKDVESELENVRSKIEEVSDELKKLKAIETPSLTDEADIARLEQELAILKQEEIIKEQTAANAQRDAMNAAEKAFDKYIEEQAEHGYRGRITETFDTKVNRIFKDYYSASSEDQAFILDSIEELGGLLDGFEYGMNNHLDSYFDTYYKLLDQYTIVAVDSQQALSSILSRAKYKDAVKGLKDFAYECKNATEITKESLYKLIEKTPEVQELFDYLISVGLWDGENWSSLVETIGKMRDSLTQLTSISIVDDIESLSDSFDTLNNALKDVETNGILSLDTLKEMMDKYPSLLSEYFTKTAEGYKLSETYDGESNYEILTTMAKKSLGDYSTILQEAKDKLSTLSEGDYDYEVALRNVAVAQDNLNTKTLEWASLLRESAIEAETNRLNDQLSSYKELIDIRKDLLETYEEEVEYQKQLAQKQKNVTDLETQLALARLDNSAAGQARARELEQQLADAQDELDEYTLEHAIDDIVSELDEQYGEYEKFINDQIENISKKITEISEQLSKIIGNGNGVSETNHTAEEMSDLYLELKEKRDNGMEISSGSDTENFMNAVASQDYKTADNLYESAKSASSSYEIPETEELTEDQEKAAKIILIQGAAGSGISRDKKGDNGEIVWNGKTYYVENGGNESATLYRAAYKEKGLGDRDIFWYDGEIYGCLDSAVVKLQQRQASYGKNSNAGYEALKRDIKEKAGIYHTGGFVGDFSSLKSNEEFAKLLKGEFVATPKQMDTFIKKTLPAIASGGSSGQFVYEQNSPLLNVEGNVTEEALPNLKILLDEALKELEKSFKSSLSRTGYKKNY